MWNKKTLERIGFIFCAVLFVMICGVLGGMVIDLSQKKTAHAQQEPKVNLIYLNEIPGYHPIYRFDDTEKNTTCYVNGTSGIYCVKNDE